MKLLRTFGRGKLRADEMIRSLEQRGSLNTSKVEKTVTEIVSHVRKQGDAAPGATRMLCGWCAARTS